MTVQQHKQQVGVLCVMTTLWGHSIEGRLPDCAVHEVSMNMNMNMNMC